MGFSIWKNQENVRHFADDTPDASHWKKVRPLITIHKDMSLTVPLKWINKGWGSDLATYDQPSPYQVKFESKFNNFRSNLKMLSSKWWSFCLGLVVLTKLCPQNVGNLWKIQTTVKKIHQNVPFVARQVCRRCICTSGYRWSMSCRHWQF